MSVDIKKIVNSKLQSDHIFEPLVDKTFEDFRIKNNNFLEKEKFEEIIRGIYKTLRLPPPSNNKIEQELKRLNKKKDGKLKKEEYKELIKDLIKVVVDSL
jgi:hypothetical protein